MENPIQITTKDPKKVEAGKRLAEYNKQQREKLRALEEKERREEFLKRNEAPEPEKPTESPRQCDTPYEIYGAAGLILIVGVVYFMRTLEKPKKKKNIQSTPSTPPTQSSPPAPLTQVVQKIIKKSPTNSTKFEME